MHCTQCGTQNEANARFCAECGAQMVSTEAYQQQAAGQQAPPIQQAPVQNSNEFAEKGKSIAKDYFRFFKQSLAGPMAASKQVTADDKINGLITHILFALFLPLFSYFTAGKLLNDTMPFGSPADISVPFGSVVVKPMFFLLIYLAVYTAVVLGVAKMMKANISYTEVMTRFGVFNVLPATLLLVAIIFSFMSVTIFSFFLFGAAISLFFVSCIAVIFSVKEEGTGGLDVFYGLLVANIAMGIIFMIIGESIVGNLINQLENIAPYGLF